MRIDTGHTMLGKPAVKLTVGAIASLLVAAGVVNCGGGGGGGTGSSLPAGQTLAASAAQVTPTNCTNVADESAANTACNNFRLTSTEVQTILAQGADAARQLGVNGVIAVVDRVGNVLGVYSTVAASAIPTGDIMITSNRVMTPPQRGLDGQTLPNATAPLFAISKAVTGAYLSSSGNAFSTRTASLIVQEHFYPKEVGTPAGPLFGVQFSQLPCGDLVRDVTQDNLAGPKRSPLGLSADPGGFPLYKNGVVVGGVGFISFGGQYTLDPEPRDTDNDPEEVIAWTATKGYEAPESIRGNRISGGGVFLLFSDTSGISTSATTLPTTGELLNVTGYKTTPAITAGIPYGAPGSGYRPSTAADGLGGSLTARNAFVLTNPGETNRYAPSAAAVPAGNSLSATDVATLLDKAYEIAFRGRAQIRFPTGSAIQVTISVVDTNGNPLGIVRTPDAPVFGTDVSLQKARTAMFMSSALSADQKALLSSTTSAFNNSKDYVNVPGFETVTKFDGSIAFSDRGFGNYKRPFYPDGNDSAANGPFSLPFSRWSPFNTGLQLDVAAGKVLANIGTSGAGRSRTCSPENGAVSLPIQNGMQIFPGGFPLYRNGVLVGGIGISGDGIDQDDMISFLGTENARRAGANVSHAPKDIRIDNFLINGARARYVNCPFKPFNDSDETNPCEGI